jgi:hypothetical protein
LVNPSSKLQSSKVRMFVDECVDKLRHVRLIAAQTPPLVREVCDMEFCDIKPAAAGLKHCPGKVGTGVPARTSPLAFAAMQQYICALHNRVPGWRSGSKKGE